MAAQYPTIDLDRLSLSPGQGTRMELSIDPGALQYGGGEYRFERGSIDGRLEVSRTISGFALRLAFADFLSGPCMRCLEQARIAVEVDAREVDQRGSEDEEMSSPYVVDGVLDLPAWAHDALALALPAQLLCRADCAGLCAVCGGTLNDAEQGAHDHPAEPDPRWAKLRELQSE